MEEYSDGDRPGNDLLELERQFREWRSDSRKGHKIPEQLWVQVIALQESCSFGEIAYTLKLNRKQLRKRFGLPEAKRRVRRKAAASHEGFVEVGVLPGSNSAECRIEIRPGGEKTCIIHLQGNACIHAVEIAKALWGAGQ